MTSCSNAGVVELQEENTFKAPQAFIVTDFREYAGSAPFAIENITLSKNLLSINIKYSGGCNEHLFQLVGHKMVSKSEPPQRSVHLFHNNNGDSCREIIQDILVFDISALAYENRETTLDIEGFDKKIKYTPIN